MRLSTALQQHAAQLSFVPLSSSVTSNDIHQLQDFIQQTKSLFVLTGAGLSTESGIPDYRSEGVGLYARTNHRPIQHVEFVRSAERRQRYWARNYVGWPRFSSAQPNESHHVLSEWEGAGRLQWLVTQNIDALHTKAGSRNVTELHGCSHRIRCLQCDLQQPRSDFQDVFHKLNPGWNFESMEIAPDGDVIIPDQLVKDFKVPDCPNCGGILKPDVVFFGDNVKLSTVESVYKHVDECDGCLVLGSSLFVYSGYRFVRRVADQKKPIAIVNIGQTRGDDLANLKISTRCGEILTKLDIRR